MIIFIITEIESIYVITLQNCDRVIQIENGQIIADGPPSLILK